MRKTRALGFTLVEIAIVMAIASTLLYVVMRQTGLLDRAKTADTIKLIQDITAAVKQFRQRYGYLPGDMPSASSTFATVSSACNMTTGSNANIGNGAIDTAVESACAVEELARADMIRATSFTKIEVQYQCRAVTCVDIVGINYARSVNAAFPVMPGSIRNVIALYNIPCETAMDIERKYDDGNLATGNFRASVTTCTPNATNDPVTIFLAPL